MEINGNPNSYNRSILILKDLIEFASNMEYIDHSNYLKSLVLLKKKKIEKISKKELKVWTPEEFEDFIKTFEKEDRKRKLFFEVEYWGALRIGEVLGLMWKDLNVENKTIFVARQLDRQSNQTSTKNASSEAPVDLPTFLIEELIEFKKEYIKIFESDKFHKSLIKTFENESYIFFVKPTSRSSAKRIFIKHCDLANLEHIRLHDLRHSMASRMINAGLNPLIVSKHLRHASTQQTLDTYSHLFPKITKGVLDNL